MMQAPEIHDFQSAMAFLTMPFHYLFNTSERVFWYYLATSLVIAMLVFYVNTRKTGDFSIRSFLAYCFPAAVYTHPSARRDYRFFYINALILSFMLPLFAGLQLWLVNATEAMLYPLGGAGAFGEITIPMVAVYTLIAALATDLFLFLVHYLQHRVPVLWEFHKTHHSAEVLTPVTVYRMHPVDDILAFAATFGVIGVMGGIVEHFFLGPVNPLTLYQLNVVFLLFYVAGYHLRHSHIWLSYGPFWSRIFVSPAQHQIHHSQAPAHWNKNMGFIFSFWDKLFNTQYIPQQKEDLVFGIDGEEEKAFSSVSALYFRPFARAFGHAGKSAIAVVALLALALGGCGYWASRQPVPPADAEGKSVYLEELTWQETRQKITDGATTVIVPTGGTEQNGPHVVLGKHNYIVHYTAGRVARALGNALVAPVIAYVPEGEAEPRPTDHMRFAGTLTVSEAVFESLLESAARSLKAHGFKTICFVGDSAWNQPGQRKIADKLSREWRAEGVRVIQVSDYYEKNRQAEWLLARGETPTDIGLHAGIRDTSELMVVFPGGVRQDKVKDYPEAGFEQMGAAGNPGRASVEVGKRLLSLKIDAAVAQIRRETALGGGN